VLRHSKHDELVRYEDGFFILVKKPCFVGNLPHQAKARPHIKLKKRNFKYAVAGL